MTNIGVWVSLLCVGYGALMIGISFVEPRMPTGDVVLRVFGLAAIALAALIWTS